MKEFYLKPLQFKASVIDNRRLESLLLEYSNEIISIKNSLSLKIKNIYAISNRLNSYSLAIEREKNILAFFNSYGDKINETYIKTETNILSKSNDSSIDSLSNRKLHFQHKENGIELSDLWYILENSGNNIGVLISVIGQLITDTPATLIQSGSLIISSFSEMMSNILESEKEISKMLGDLEDVDFLEKAGDVASIVDFISGNVGEFDKQLNSNAKWSDAWNKFYGIVAADAGIEILISKIPVLDKVDIIADKTVEKVTGSNIREQFGEKYAGETGNLRDDLNAIYDKAGLLPYVAASGANLAWAFQNASNVKNIYHVEEGITASSCAWACIESLSDVSGFSDIIEEKRRFIIEREKELTERVYSIFS